MTGARRTVAGFIYIKSNPLLFGLILLDLFAVLLGGVAALLPIFAKDVLHVGPSGLGALAAAMGVGAVVTATWFSVRPMHHNVGVKMLIAVGVFFPVYLGVMGAILSVDRTIVEVGRIFRLSGPALVRRILLPAVLPAYVIALRAGLGLGWMFVVAAEFMGASEGLGYLLIDGQQLGKPAQIIAAILTFAVLGKLSDACLAAGAAPFLRWEDAFGARG